LSPFQLKRFQKVFLEVNQEILVTFSLNIDDLSFYGIDNTKIYEAGSFVIEVGTLRTTFELIVG